MNFSLEHKKLIYNAVRKYQMNHVGLTSKNYQLCDEILNALFKEVKDVYVEPGFETEN